MLRHSVLVISNILFLTPSRDAAHYDVLAVEEDHRDRINDQRGMPNAPARARQSVPKNRRSAELQRDAVDRGDQLLILGMQVPRCRREALVVH